MNLTMYVRRILQRDDVRHAIVLVVKDEMVAPGVPELGRRIEDHSDVYGIDQLNLHNLIAALRTKADSLEQELKILKILKENS